MELTPMQYKTYTWPYNPKTYSISYERKVAVHKVPFGRYTMQDLGLTRRVMRGEGEFCGEGAYDEFKKLATVFYRDGPGTLIHPVWQTSKAYFVELSLAQEPRPDYVRYTFTFWETYEFYSEKLMTPAEKARKNSSSGTTSTGTAGTTTTTTTTTTAKGDEQYHTVAQGETLWGISKAWGLTLAEIMILNPQIKNPNVITTGQKVRVK